MHIRGLAKSMVLEIGIIFQQVYSETDITGAIGVSVESGFIWIVLASRFG
jgi:hypothetical protein